MNAELLLRLLPFCFAQRGTTLLTRRMVMSMSETEHGLLTSNRSASVRGVRNHRMRCTPFFSRAGLAGYPNARRSAAQIYINIGLFLVLTCTAYCSGLLQSAGSRTRGGASFFVALLVSSTTTRRPRPAASLGLGLQRSRRGVPLWIVLHIFNVRIRVNVLITPISL